MSEHRRKPPQPQGGGRAAARRGQAGSSAGRRAAPRGATGSPTDSYGSGFTGAVSEEREYGGRAEARRAAQRSAGGRRKAPEPGRGGRRGAPGGPNGPGRGRGRAAPPPNKRFIDYPRAGKDGLARWTPSWRLVTGAFLAFMGGLIAAAGIGYAMVGIPKAQDTALAQNNVFYWSNGKQMAATGGQTNRQLVSDAEIPREMKDAVVSAENASFYDDKGIDPAGIGRALLNMAETPTPSVAPSPTETVEESPTPTPTPSETENSPTPTPTGTCSEFDWQCDNSNGGQNGGTDGGTTSSPTPTVTETDNTGGNANGNGGIFGGPSG
ncbi:hypothetical protein SCHAM137S_01661 [Streptomyces chartreusis]